VPERLPLWWRIFNSEITFAVGLAVGLAFLFGWRSLHWESSLLDRLPWWGPAIPVVLWLVAVGSIWWRRRRRNEAA
jgi:hypothetical protein